MMSISDELGPYFLRRKIEPARSLKQELHGEGFIFRQIRHFSLINNMIKVLFPICTLNCCVNNFVSSQGKGRN